MNRQPMVDVSLKNAFTCPFHRSPSFSSYTSVMKTKHSASFSNGYSPLMISKLTPESKLPRLDYCRIRLCYDNAELDLFLDHSTTLLYQAIQLPSSFCLLASLSSSSRSLSSTMKKLIDSRKYRESLDLFHRQSQATSDTTLLFALKATARLRDRERGVAIHQQLSSSSLRKPSVQTSLIHFHS